MIGAALIIILEALFALFIIVVLIYLIIKRIRDAENEDFEKRDW